MNKVVNYCYDNTEKPIYEQIADIMKKDISNGRIPPGKQLLPELKLAESFNVSLVTMQRALKLLAQENLLVRSTKKGTFISESAVKLLSFKNIGLIMPALGTELTLSQSPTNYLIFDGIQKYCLENSWDIQIIQKRYEAFSRERISQSNVSGLILVLPNKSSYGLITELKKHKAPFICINLHSEKINKDVNFVNIDFYNTAIDAVKYLYEKGKKNIAIVRSCEMHDYYHQFHIMKGYRQAIKSAGLKENIITADAHKGNSPADANGKLSQALVSDFFRTNLQKIRKYDAVITMDPECTFSLSEILNEENSESRLKCLIVDK